MMQMPPSLTEGYPRDLNYYLILALGAIMGIGAVFAFSVWLLGD